MCHHASPRYLYSPALTQILTETLTLFTRAALPDFGSMSLDVYQPAGVRITGSNQEEQLERVATSHILEWEKEGATEIKVETERLPRLKGRPQIAAYARFRTGTKPTHSLSRWFVDWDGSVFRVAVGAPPFVIRDELSHDLELVVKSWRRIQPLRGQVQSFLTRRLR